MKAAFWLSLIALLIVSSLPGAKVEQSLDVGDIEWRLDYVLHFIAYLCISALMVLAYGHRVRLFAGLVIFALLEEVHQYWIPGRTVNPYDFLFDFLGISFTFILSRLYVISLNE
jgi:VanZ family protein